MAKWILLALFLTGCSLQTTQIQNTEAETAKVERELKRLEPARPEIENLRRELATVFQQNQALEKEIAALRAAR